MYRSPLHEVSLYIARSEANKQNSQSVNVESGGLKNDLYPLQGYYLIFNQQFPLSLQGQ